MPYLLSTFFLGMAFCLLGTTITLAAEPPNEQFFEQSVRPLLAKRCFDCHGSKKQQGGLRLDAGEFLLKGNENGPALVAGKPDESRLMEVLRYEDGDVQMPPAGKLPDSERAILRTWIADGAFWPNDSAASTNGQSAAQEEWKLHWAFQPIRRPELPTVQRSDWPKTAVDHFILARLERRKLGPSPPADRRTWLRRVAFDLTGLPPTREEVKTFLADASPQAKEKVVNRLLASPRYGERWARHWLDVARYSDTKGYVFQEDRNYPEAYTYRDWVIQSLNDDVPFDRFVKYQIAADHYVDESNQEELAAMGYLTLGRRFLNNRHDIIDDRIDVTTRGLMGLTVTCARCHDHKYDPIPAADYYSLYGVFASSEEPKNAPSPLRLVDASKPYNPYVFLRGSAGNRGPSVPRQFLLCLSGEERQPFSKGSGRRELAEQIASPNNPLTARVIVNRIWGHYFGSHLVNTPSDFGLRSTPPTHPQLLDWLAAELIENGWSLKQLHRRIALSATYGQSAKVPSIKSTADADFARNVDPENSLLWHVNRRRLDFEALRDATLFVSGTLDLTMGGPSVHVESAPFSHRRTVYGFVDRQNLPGTFRTFDFANPDTHSPQRYHTTVPQQALFLMNSPFLLEQALSLASRLDSLDADSKISRLYHLCLARDPSSEELALGRAYVLAEEAQQTRKDFRGPRPKSLTIWEKYAQVLLLSNEFAFID